MFREHHGLLIMILGDSNQAFNDFSMSDVNTVKCSNGDSGVLDKIQINSIDNFQARIIFR